VIIRRREFLAALGGAASWPLAAQGQQAAMPVVGFLNGGSPDGYARATNRFHEGLQETGYIVGQNVAIEYRWAQGQYDRLPALAADLVDRRVAVLVVNNAAALAAKAATATIPIVFASGGDPVRQGLVVSLNRPGGNLTGVYFLIGALATKNLGLLHELVPKATVIGVLLNPTDPNAEGQSRSLQGAAPKLGLQLHVLEASAESDFERAFATLVQWRAGALLVTADSFFFARRQQLVMLATRHSVPTVYPWREAAEAGGLMSYSVSVADAYRQVGIYAGRILKGEKTVDLPVQQSTKFELVINLKAANALGITPSAGLLSIVDEVIE
jgi:putative ABC transport system substrate-binding protein